MTARKAHPKMKVLKEIILDMHEMILTIKRIIFQFSEI